MVSDTPVSAENIIFEAFDVVGVVGELSMNYLHGEREKLIYVCFSTTLLPYQNKGFVNYVFCNNWAVRNPAGTRLDSLA